MARQIFNRVTGKAAVDAGTGRGRMFISDVSKW